MAYLQIRGNKWRAKVRIPKPLRSHYSGKEFLQETMGAMDKPSARLEASTWEAGLRLKWAELSNSDLPTRHAQRRVYEAYRSLAVSGAFEAFGDPETEPKEFGIELELDKLADKDRSAGLSERDEVQLAALQDALTELRGERPPIRRELEPTFSESAAEYLDLWATQSGLKPSNTRQQKEATFRLTTPQITSSGQSIIQGKAK